MRVLKIHGLRGNIAFILILFGTIFLSSPCLVYGNNVLEEQSVNTIQVFIDNVNVNSLNADVRFSINLSGNRTDHNITLYVENTFVINENDTRSGNFFRILLHPETNLTLNNEIIGQTFIGEQKQTVRLFGEKQAYPFDAYMMNFTIRIPFESLNENNTYANAPYSSPIDWHQRESTLKTKVWHNEGYSYVNFQIIIDRASWDVSFLSYVYIPFFIFLGGLTLIDVRNFNGKLSVYTSLFLTSSTGFLLYFSSYIPAKSGTTILYYLYYFILLTLVIYFIYDLLILNDFLPSNSIITAPIVLSIFIYSSWRVILEIFNIYSWLNIPTEVGKNIVLTLLPFSVLHFLSNRSQKSSQTRLDDFFKVNNISNSESIYLIVLIFLLSTILFIIIMKL